MKNISVIGAGTMGNGIAHVFAQNGFTVKLVDVSQERLDTALGIINKNIDRQIAKGALTEEAKESIFERLTTFDSLPEGVKGADLVVEAATENIDLKLSIFKQLDQMVDPDCILASNTSSISITKIGSATKRPDMVVGMHFMNPVPIMKLVEIINGYSTAPQVTDRIVELSKLLGKVPCVVNDYPGFVANRILMPMINESICALHEGVAGVAEIDMVMKLGMAHPMGPLQLADFIGLDVCLNILNVLYEGFKNQKYAASPLLVNMVIAGFYGVKSGEGFYRYNNQNKDQIVSPRFSLRSD